MSLALNTLSPVLSICPYLRSWGDLLLDIFPSLLCDSSRTEVSLREGMPRRLLLVKLFVWVTVTQLKIIHSLYFFLAGRVHVRHVPHIVCLSVCFVPYFSKLRYNHLLVPNQHYDQDLV